MLERFKQSMVELGAFDPARPFLAGISGGADSLALLFLLHRTGYPVIAAYFDHNLRPESKEEGRQVSQIASRLDLPYVLGEHDVRAHAGKHGLTIEAAARVLRYQFLFEQAQETSSQAVVVAHHADDQVETVLLHLLRGSGLEGLQGMSAVLIPNPWSTTIPLLRPLLSFWKGELEYYVKALGIQPVQDMTNFDPIYLRNRLRHEVIPYLEKIQPGLRPSLLRLAKITQDELAILEPLEEGSWQACFRRQGDNYIVLSVPALHDQPVGLLRRVCRRALDVLRPGLPDIDFNAVERMAAFILSPARVGQLDIVSGLRLLLEGDDLWLASWDAALPADNWPQLPGAQACLPVQVPGRIDLPGGWFLSADLEENVELVDRLSADNTDPFQAWLDFDRCGMDLVLRGRWEGARFQPLGLNGQTQKVSDRMIDAHLPKRARELWPLLCSGDQVLWIPGLAVAHPVRLTDQTRQVLHLVVSKSDGS